MDWTLVLAILCLTAASAMADTSNNQTGVYITSLNTTVPAGVFNLVFSINETFVPALANTSSPNFTAKAESVRNQIEPVYRKRFSNFIRMVINSFSNGSIVTDSSLEFSSNGTIPTVSEVQDTLVNATNTTSSLNIIASSINVPQVPVTNTTTNTSGNTSSTNTPSTNTPSTNTPVPAAVFNLVFSINETFVPALANTGSPEFKAKALSISNQLEPVYRQRFSNFIRMVINSFSNGSIVTNSSLEFSSNGTIPTVSEVQGTLVNATNTTSSLNIIASSINVPQVPGTNTTTNTSGNTTSPNTPVPAAAFNLVFSINETFVPALANTGSPEFKSKALSIRNQLEPVYRQRFSNFIRMVINSFSNGSIVTNSSLEFSSNDTIPTVSEVQDTLVNATNTTSSLNIIASSINVPQVPVTNTTTNTSTNTTVVAAAFNLVFSINETFVPALANTSSPEFKAKALSISNQIEPVYRQRFSNFIRMVINSFRNGSIVTNSSLEFSSNGTIPTVSEVQDTLVNATNTTSSLNIIASSINVPQVPGTNTTTNTSGNTTSPNTPVVAAAFNLVFSINETFDPLLANTSSPNFTAKAQSIRNQIEPVYRKRFINFIRMVINSFRNGSTVINSSLEFSSNGTIPTVSEVKGTLVNATNTTSSLNIIPSSISVTQTFGNSTTTPTSNSMSPVIASSLSMIWMSLLTLLLSVALHF